MAGFRHIRRCSFIQLNEIGVNCDQRLRGGDYGLF